MTDEVPGQQQGEQEALLTLMQHLEPQHTWLTIAAASLSCSMLSATPGGRQKAQPGRSLCADRPPSPIAGGQATCTHAVIATVDRGSLQAVVAPTTGSRVDRIVNPRG